MKSTSSNFNFSNMIKACCLFLSVVIIFFCLYQIQTLSGRIKALENELLFQSPQPEPQSDSSRTFIEHNTHSLKDSVLSVQNAESVHRPKREIQNINNVRAPNVNYRNSPVRTQNSIQPNKSAKSDETQLQTESNPEETIENEYEKPEYYEDQENEGEFRTLKQENNNPYNDNRQNSYSRTKPSGQNEVV